MDEWRRCRLKNLNSSRIKCFASARPKVLMKGFFEFQAAKESLHHRIVVTCRFMLRIIP